MHFKRITSLALACQMFLGLSGIVYAETPNEIPEKMSPNTVIEYNEACEAMISVKLEPSFKSARSIVPMEMPDTLSREAEDAMAESILEDVEDYPVYNSESFLPTPEPGMRIVYGTDGYINHVYSATGDEISLLSALPRGTRAPIGTHKYGVNTIAISHNQVLGTGRATVFEGKIGDHDNLLKVGDIATKSTLDNPYSGTTIALRNLDNDIKKNMIKNDNGSLPNAIIDIYQWDPQWQYFGEYYRPTLSFPNMRYWYAF